MTVQLAILLFVVVMVQPVIGVPPVSAGLNEESDSTKDFSEAPEERSGGDAR